MAKALGDSGGGAGRGRWGKGIKPVDPVCSLPLLCHQVFSFETAPSPPTRSVPAPRAGSAGTRSVQSVLVQPRPQTHTHNPPTHLMLKVSSRQPFVWSLGVRVTPQPAPPLPCPVPHTLPRPPVSAFASPPGPLKPSA